MTMRHEARGTVEEVPSKLVLSLLEDKDWPFETEQYEADEHSTRITEGTVYEILRHWRELDPSKRAFSTTGAGFALAWIRGTQLGISSIDRAHNWYNVQTLSALLGLVYEEVPLVLTPEQALDELAAMTFNPNASPREVKDKVANVLQRTGRKPL